MQLDTTWSNLSIPPFSMCNTSPWARKNANLRYSATNSDSNEDVEPRQPTQLANLDLTESQKARRSQNGKAADAPAVDGESNERAQTDEMFQVTIGTKSLLKFLSTNVSNSGTIACKFASWNCRSLEMLIATVSRHLRRLLSDLLHLHRYVSRRSSDRHLLIITRFCRRRRRQCGRLDDIHSKDARVGVNSSKIKTRTELLQSTQGITIRTTSPNISDVVYLQKSCP
jgi:hypothetical protein